MQNSIPDASCGGGSGSGRGNVGVVVEAGCDAAFGDCAGKLGT